MRKTAIAILIPCLVLGMTAGVTLGQNGSYQRPLDDFLSAQGTFNFGLPGPLIAPPVNDFLIWDNSAQGDPIAIRASVDYAGVADAWSGGAFGTQISGIITETPLADGRARVHVRIRTTNALTWAIECPNPPNGCLPGVTGQEAIFGNYAQDVLEGAEPALGRSFLRVLFINPAPNAPMPDLLQLLVAPAEGQQFLNAHMVGTAFGPLADGTEGMLHITEVGLLFGPGQAPIFPASVIIIEPL